MFYKLKRKNMLALRFYGRRDIRLEKMEKPKLQKDEVLIRVIAAGISQTQINEFVEGPFIINKEIHPLTKKAIPLVPSQEFGGIVEEVGEDVDRSWLGKMVAVLPLVTCKKCKSCKEKRENLCENVAYYGLLGLDGGFSEYCAVKSENIFEVKKENLLTFIEPLLVGMHAGDRIGKTEGKKILVLGAGAIGISVAAVLRDYFKADVYLNDILNARLRRAKKSGFEVLFKNELKREFDVVVDAAGMDTIAENPAIIEGFEYIKKGGIVLNVGTYFHPIEFVPSKILFFEQALVASILYTSKEIEKLNDALVSLKVNFDDFIEEISLRNIIEDGYMRAEVDKESFVRLVVVP